MQQQDVRMVETWVCSLNTVVQAASCSTAVPHHWFSNITSLERPCIGLVAHKKQSTYRKCMKSMHCTFMCNPLFSLHEQILSEVKESQLVTLSSPFFNLFCVVGVKLQQCSSAQNVLNFFSFFGCLFQFFFFFWYSFYW